jgi:hypothetical protein
MMVSAQMVCLALVEFTRNVDLHSLGCFPSGSGGMGGFDKRGEALELANCRR